MSVSETDYTTTVAGYSLLVSRFFTPVLNKLHLINIFQAYDYFLNLNDEITLIWPTPLNIGKTLYLLVRYVPFIDGALLLYGKDRVQKITGQNVIPFVSSAYGCTPDCGY